MGFEPLPTGFGALPVHYNFAQCCNGANRRGCGRLPVVNPTSCRTPKTKNIGKRMSDYVSPATQTEVQAIASKLDELIRFLQRA